MNTTPQTICLRTNTILYCDRWEPAVSFYRDILDLPVHHQTDWMVEFKLTAQSYVSIANASRTRIPSARGNGITLSFQVQDVVHARAVLIEKGVQAGDMLTVWGSRAFYVFDPEGHRIEIWS